MPNKFVEGQYPIYLERGEGSVVYDSFDNNYIDFPCGLGAILLGYSYPEVDEAVIEQLSQGILFTLPSYLETELAIKLNKLIPCAEQVRFLKTGSEACSAAVKIARAYTNREKVVVCGYHGWHDWFTISTPKKKGIPKSYADLILKGEYNDLDSFEYHIKHNDIACVILEPYIYEAPKDDFLKKLIKLAHKYGTLVIFDEVVTGFRTVGYSAQKMFNATPDLACFGKAMANGLPIGVVCGRRDVMKELEGDCFVSSTFGGELLSITAAIATINELETENCIDAIWSVGAVLKEGYNHIAKDLQIETSCIGFPNRTMFLFPTGNHKSLFWQECINRGVLFGYAQFINYSHSFEQMDYVLEVIKDALTVVKKYWENPLKGLRGLPAKEVFRTIATRR